MEGAFCWLKMLMVKNDNKSQITVFCVFIYGKLWLALHLSYNSLLKIQSEKFISGF